MFNLNIVKNSKLGNLAFQNAVAHLEKEVVGELRKQAERTGRKDLFEIYSNASLLFEKFKKERRFDLALKLEAGYRPH